MDPELIIELYKKLVHEQQADIDEDRDPRRKNIVPVADDDLKGMITALSKECCQSFDDNQMRFRNDIPDDVVIHLYNRTRRRRPNSTTPDAVSREDAKWQKRQMMPWK